MGAGIDLPIVEGGATKTVHFALITQFGERVIANIGRKHMTPKQRHPICSRQHRDAATFARMIGNFDVAPKIRAAVVGNRGVDGGAVVGFFRRFCRFQIALIDPRYIDSSRAIDADGIESMGDFLAIGVNGDRLWKSLFCRSATARNESRRCRVC